MEKRRTKYSCKYLQVYLSCQRMKMFYLNTASEKAYGECYWSAPLVRCTILMIPFWLSLLPLLINCFLGFIMAEGNWAGIAPSPSVPFVPPGFGVLPTPLPSILLQYEVFCQTVSSSSCLINEPISPCHQQPHASGWTVVLRVLWNINSPGLLFPKQ